MSLFLAHPVLAVRQRQTMGARECGRDVTAMGEPKDQPQSRASFAQLHIPLSRGSFRIAILLQRGCH